MIRHGYLPVAPAPALKRRTLDPGTDAEFTFGDLDFFLVAFGAFAASSALGGNFLWD